MVRAPLPARPASGRRFNLTLARNEIIQARVTRMIANELFAFEWPLEDVHLPTQVAISLEPLGNGTLVKITDGEFEADLKEAKRFYTVVQGWTGYLWNLKSVVVHGIDLRSEWE
jgi:hypothetical protein